MAMWHPKRRQSEVYRSSSNPFQINPIALTSDLHKRDNERSSNKIGARATRGNGQAKVWQAGAHERRLRLVGAPETMKPCMTSTSR